MLGVKIDVLATDRHKMIACNMRKDHPEVKVIPTVAMTFQEEYCSISTTFTRISQNENK